MSSFSPKVDYSLRPAKSVERRMIAEVLSYLDSIESLTEARYVGMGSIYFQDFQLFHRRLGVTEMLSIEREDDAAERMLENLPLACVELEVGSVSDLLPSLELEERLHILWLDYEGRVDDEVLSDVRRIVGRVRPGSALFVTTNGHRGPYRKVERWLNGIRHAVAGAEVPDDADGVRRLSYQALNGTISDAVEARNAGRLSSEPEVIFAQVVHFWYSDGAPMFTVGGLILEEQQSDLWNGSGVLTLPFVKCGENPFQITVPFLTKREVVRLLAKMPADEQDLSAIARDLSLPLDDVKAFSRIYRFSSLFSETEIW